MADTTEKTPEQTPDTPKVPAKGAPKTEAKPKAEAKKHARTARTQVKYAGEWYEPGQPVPFKTAADAEPYDAENALEPEK